MGRHKGTRIWYDNQDGKSILRKYKQLWSPWKISRSWTMDHQYHDSVSELWQRSSSKTPKNSKRNGTLHPITWTIPHPMPSIYHKLQLLPPRCPLSLVPKIVSFYIIISIYYILKFIYYILYIVLMKK